MTTFSQPPYLIRPIEQRDNLPLKDAIFECLQDYGEKAERYIADTPQFYTMYEYYQKPRARYWVVENTETGEILGGGGYIVFPCKKPAHLDVEICEFQKFYFHSSLRGKGMGKAMLNLVMDTARLDGFDLIYLETLTEMSTAISLYEKVGFKKLSEPIGKTPAETPCNVYMACPITAEPLVLPTATYALAV